MEKDTPKQLPLLMDELQLAEKVMLAQTSLTPGYQILVRMMTAACKQATEDTIKVDPENPDYDQILKARQQYSRAVNKFCALVLKSVEYHKECGAAEEIQKEMEVLQTVGQS